MRSHLGTNEREQGVRKVLVVTVAAVPVPDADGGAASGGAAGSGAAAAEPETGAAAEPEGGADGLAAALQEQATFGADGDCSICQDVIEGPQVLECGHVFCTECISEMRKFVTLEQSCPNCRHPFNDQTEEDFDAGARGYVRVERRRSRQGLRWEDIEVGATGAHLVGALDGSLLLLARAAGIVFDVITA